MRAHRASRWPSWPPGYAWVPRTIRVSSSSSSVSFTTNLFHSSASPLVNRSLDKCFPSLLAIFIPLSELFPLVSSSLAQGGQPPSGASKHVQAGGAGWWASGRGRNRGGTEERGRARRWGTAFCSDGSGCGRARCSFIPPFQFVKTILPEGSVCRGPRKQTISDRRPK